MLRAPDMTETGRHFLSRITPHLALPKDSSGRCSAGFVELGGVNQVGAGRSYHKSQIVRGVE
jgi:hypothetical protein